MKKKQGNPTQAEALRHKAELLLREECAAAEGPETPPDLLRSLHELQVHQVELQMQNEALAESRSQIEAGFERYMELYDFAPVAYFTLTRDGTIRQANLTGARLLGVERAQLVGRRLGQFLVETDRTLFSTFLDKVWEDQASAACEVALGSKAHPPGSSTGPREARPVYLHIEAKAVAGGQECRAIVMDVTARKLSEDALCTSEARHRALIDNIQLGVTLLDRNYRVIMINAAQARMFKKPPASFIGQQCFLEFEKRDHICAHCPGARAMATLQPAEEETEGVRDDGHRFSVRVQSFPVLGADGQAEGFVEIVEDLSERKRLELQYRTILQTATEGFWVMNEQGRFLEVNDAFCQMSGYGREELLKMSIPDLEAVESPPDTAAHIQRVKDGKNARFETRHRRRDGRLIDVEISVKYLGNGENKFFIFARDITERKRADAMLRESEASFRTLIGAITDYTYHMTVHQGQVTSTTHGPGCLAITGYTPEEFQADPELWFRMVYPEDKPGTLDWAAKMLVNQMGGPWEHRIIKKNGDVRWVRNLVVQRTIDGKPGGVYDGLIQDITKYRAMRDQMIKAQKMEAVGQLAGGVAHDFRNQLTVIKGYGEMLARCNLIKEEGRGPLNHILKAADRSATISGQLLAFSRQLTLKPEAVNLCSLTGDMMKSLTRTLGEDIQWLVKPCPNVWTVRLDAGQFQQALLNLVLNARDAMPGGGQLTIETENIVWDEDSIRGHANATVGRFVMLTIRDSGDGMNSETLAHIFEPFFTTKPIGEGTGLGLAMVHGFVAQSGGVIEVQSQPGQGTTFRIFFPAVDDVAPLPKPDSQAAILPRGSETILVVEDEEPIRMLMRETLGECGYTVLAAGNSREAQALIKSAQNKIDLLITDVVMPGESGAELAKHFHAVMPHATILMISGHTGKMLVEHGVVPHDMNLLIKPFSPRTLTQTVRKLLRHG